MATINGVFSLISSPRVTFQPEGVEMGRPLIRKCFKICAPHTFTKKMSAGVDEGLSEDPHNFHNKNMDCIISICIKVFL